MRNRIKAWLKRIALTLLGMILSAFILAYLIPLPARLEAQGSTIVTYQDGTPAYVFLAPDDHWRIDTTTNQVDPDYLAALLAYEDKRFYYHFGVDPLAVGRALYQNIKAGSVVSGASTLTMQVVRILEPRPRTLGSKIIEAMRAVQLEIRLSKEEILSSYLRFAPFGKNIEGVQAAAFAYFGHDAQALSPMEISYLVATPQNPNQRYPSNKNAKFMRKAVNHAAEQLHRAKVFSKEQLQQVIAEELPARLRKFPRDMRQAAIWIQGLNPKEKRIKTSIERSVQQKARKIMTSYKDQLKTMGIHNGAMVVIENYSGKVLSLVANFDYWDRENQGQVVGFLGPRSPGSTLKPFIYALAIDRGFLLPSYLIEDIPVRYASYEPKNYDERYRGLIKAESALAHSLNIPAVVQLKQIGVFTFLSFLENCGISTLGEHERYGLSVAIGGLELNLLELTNLYAALARNGAYLPWTIYADFDHLPQRYEVLSPGAGYLTRQALKTKDRPDFPSRRRTVQAAGDFFWKTGTSYGHRDAWAIGSNQTHTVGVWLGNFDGRPAKALVGGERAGPILFDMLDALTNRQLLVTKHDQIPQDLQEVEVCALSGRLPSHHCPKVHKQLAKKKSLPTEVCRLHHTIDVDDHTGHALCPVCRAGRSYTSKVFTLLPAAVRRWVSDQNLMALAPPSHLPGCRQVHGGAKLKITQPQANTIVYLVDGLDPKRQEIPLEVDTQNSINDVYWFVNGHLHTQAAPDQRAWLTPKEGEFEIKVVDDTGQGDRVNIRVVKL
jgi:penicillin-binding protein 1C